MREPSNAAGDARYTLGVPDEEDPMPKGAKKDSDNQITLRLVDAKSMRARADALSEEFAEDPGMKRYGPWSRHRVLRVALETGMDLLEDKSKKGGRRR